MIVKGTEEMVVMIDDEAMWNREQRIGLGGKIGGNVGAKKQHFIVDPRRQRRTMGHGRLDDGGQWHTIVG
jgi:hypothetical protein